MQCKRGTGTIQWNAGSWFGPQVGGTFWLLGSAFLLLGQTPQLAAVLFGCFVLPNLVGTIIWMNRDKLDPYRALQALILALFVFTTIALVSADWFGVLGELDQRFKNPRQMYFVLLMYPTLMTILHFRNRATSRATEPNS